MVWGPGCSRGTIRISNSLPTRGYKLTPLSELVLPESHHLRPNFANLSVWISALLSPSPALTSALLLFPRPTSITLSFPAFLPLLHPSHLTLSPSLPGFPLSQLSVAGPGPSAAGRHPGVLPDWAWLLGEWGGNQQMFAIRRGPRRPRPSPPGAGSCSPSTLGAERARQESPQIRPG